MKTLALFAIIMLAATTVFGAGQNDVLGLWNTADNDSKLEFFKCGEKVCVKIAWLKEPNYTDSKEGPVGTPKVDQFNPDKSLRKRPMLGLQIMDGFTAVSDDRWENGVIYNPDNGKSYRGKLHLVSPKKLQLRGYLGISLFGSNYMLTR